MFCNGVADGICPGRVQVKMESVVSRKDDSLVEYVCDQLDDMDAIVYKSMFGGYGLYSGSVFFGIVYDGRLYFKTDEATRARYLEWDSAPFQPNAKQTLKSYYEVPGEMIDNAGELSELAIEAANVAFQSR